MPKLTRPANAQMTHHTHNPIHTNLRPLPHGTIPKFNSFLLNLGISTVPSSLTLNDLFSPSPFPDCPKPWLIRADNGGLAIDALAPAPTFTLGLCSHPPPPDEAVLKFPSDRAGEARAAECKFGLEPLAGAKRASAEASAAGEALVRRPEPRSWRDFGPGVEEGAAKREDGDAERGGGGAGRRMVVLRSTMPGWADAGAEEEVRLESSTGCTVMEAVTSRLMEPSIDSSDVRFMPEPVKDAFEAVAISRSLAKDGLDAIVAVCQPRSSLFCRIS